MVVTDFSFFAHPVQSVNTDTKDFGCFFPRVHGHSNTSSLYKLFEHRRLWDLVAKRQAKDRVYYRYINGVKTPFKVEAKLGAKSKHGNCVYSIDFEVTPHILRHTYVSNLLLAGVDIKTVQYLAGHEKSKTTLDIYAHLAYNKPEDTIVKVRRAFDTDTKPPS